MNTIGRFIIGETPIELNQDLESVELIVSNTGDRGIQIGSHFHFFEVNKALVFEREEAFGMHLDIAAGTAVRFEPGQRQKVRLCAYRGAGIMRGFNDLTNGAVTDERVRANAVAAARREGFIREE